MVGKNVKREAAEVGRDIGVELGKWALRKIWDRIKARIQRRRAARKGK